MAWCPFAQRFRVRNHSGSLAANDGVILHVQAGNGTLRRYFDRPEVQASSTWWVSKAGVLEQYVDSDLRAWAQGAGNATYNSVETEGFPGEPLTDAQVNTLAKLYRWGHQVHGWPLEVIDTPGLRGFGFHGMGGKAWGGHPGCAGDLRNRQRPRILSLAAGGIPTDQEVDELTADELFMLRFSFVQSAYQQIIGRPASNDDIINGVSALAKGMSQEQFRGLIARSPEAKARAQKG